MQCALKIRIAPRRAGCADNDQNHRSFFKPLDNWREMRTPQSIPSHEGPRLIYPAATKAVRSQRPHPGTAAASASAASGRAARSRARSAPRECTVERFARRRRLSCLFREPPPASDEERMIR